MQKIILNLAAEYDILLMYAIANGTIWSTICFNSFKIIYILWIYQSYRKHNNNSITKNCNRYVEIKVV